jgi:hypothetical protein
MTMSFNNKYLVLVALLTAGCGGGGYDGGGGGNNHPPPSGATNTAFVPFIKSQLAQTSDTAEPLDVNDRQFQFDDESETSFDDVLQ